MLLSIDSINSYIHHKTPVRVHTGIFSPIIKKYIAIISTRITIYYIENARLFEFSRIGRASQRVYIYIYMYMSVYTGQENGKRKVSRAEKGVSEEKEKNRASTAYIRDSPQQLEARCGKTRSGIRFSEARVRLRGCKRRALPLSQCLVIQKSLFNVIFFYFFLFSYGVFIIGT